MDSETRSRRSYTLLAGGMVALLVAVGGIAWANRDSSHPAATAPTTATPSWSASAPDVPDGVRVAWAYLDSTDGTVHTGGDDELHQLDHLVVPGIAEDYLNTLDQRGQDAGDADMAIITAALAGDQDAGDMLVKRAGGLDAAFTRVIDSCALERARMSPPRATALDTARYAACLREGAVANPDLAGVVVERMRGGAGGIGDVRGNDGGQRLAQFNSTVPDGDGRLRTRCMGIGAYWSAAVMVNFPAARGDLFGTATCAEVARTEFPPDTQPAPESGSPAPEGAAQD